MFGLKWLVLCCTSVYCNIVARYDETSISDIDGCFSSNQWCGCSNDSVIIGFYRESVPDNIWYINDGPKYLTKLKCGKPTNMIIDNCINVDISTEFDRSGSIYCPQNYFIQSIHSNGYDQYIYQWENILCCTFISIYQTEYILDNQINNDWNLCLDSGGWCNVTQNTFMNGLSRSCGINLCQCYNHPVHPNCAQVHGNGLHNIEQAHSRGILLLGTEYPTVSPSIYPSESPSIDPTISPSVLPTMKTTLTPSQHPTVSPSKTPIVFPGLSHSQTPSIASISTPDSSPTNTPALSPTVIPSEFPSNNPSSNPTISPSYIPSTSAKNRINTKSYYIWMSIIIIFAGIIGSVCVVTCLYAVHKFKQNKLLDKTIIQMQMAQENTDNESTTVSPDIRAAPAYKKPDNHHNSSQMSEGNIRTTSITTDMTNEGSIGNSYDTNNEITNGNDTNSITPNDGSSLDTKEYMDGNV